MTNASEAIGDRDGVIRVATRQARANQGSSEAIPGLAADIDYVQLEVSDTGRGMPPDIKGKVFDPFFTTKIAGHGLGLAIVSRVAETHDGSVTVENRPTGGAAFTLRLRPAPPRPAATTLGGLTAAK